MDLEQSGRLIGPFEYGQRVSRIGFLPAEELFYFRDVLARYCCEPQVIGNRVPSHGDH